MNIIIIGSDLEEKTFSGVEQVTPPGKGFEYWHLRKGENVVFFIHQTEVKSLIMKEGE